MAWDDVSPGGPYLWLWSQDFSPPVHASQYDPSTYSLTGLSFSGKDIGDPADNLAGGATIRDDVFPHRLVLVGLHQAVPDTVVGYDLGGLLEYRIYLPLALRNATQ